MRETLVRQRQSLVGATIEFVVLAGGRRTCIGIDLESGAFVRASEPLRNSPIRPFTVVRGIASSTTLDRPEQPEYVRFSESLVVTDRLDRRKMDKLVRPLVHPKHRPLLGFHGPSAPWWEHETSGSVALVEPERGPVVELAERGLRCRFLWSGLHYDLPLEDTRILAKLDWLPTGPVPHNEISTIMGFRPDRLVVALGRPDRGYCPKVIAGFIPRT